MQVNAQQDAIDEIITKVKCLFGPRSRDIRHRIF